MDRQRSHFLATSFMADSSYIMVDAQILSRHGQKGDK